VCNLIKIGLTFLLIPIPKLNILGAIIASLLANVIYFILNFLRIRKDFAITPVTFGDFGKVLLSAFIMVLTAHLILEPATAFAKNIYVGFFAAMFEGLLAYALSLILFGAVKKEEITHFRG
jgi:stage V sporulation protein B